MKHAYNEYRDMGKYTDQMLIDRMREVEMEFPLVVPPFPTSDIRDIIDNPEHPDEEGRECGEPFLNQNWMDVTEKQWSYNDVFASFSTSKAQAYFLPSIIRFSYLEELMQATKYMANVNEWTMNILMLCEVRGGDNTWRVERTQEIYRLCSITQLDVVEKWIEFENRMGVYKTEYQRGLALLEQARLEKSSQ